MQIALVLFGPSCTLTKALGGCVRSQGREQDTHKSRRPSAVERIGNARKRRSKSRTKTATKFASSQCHHGRYSRVRTAGDMRHDDYDAAK